MKKLDLLDNSQNFAFFKISSSRNVYKTLKHSKSVYNITTNQMKPSPGTTWIFKNYFFGFEKIKTTKCPKVGISKILIFENVKVWQIFLKNRVDRWSRAVRIQWCAQNLNPTKLSNSNGDFKFCMSAWISYWKLKSFVSSQYWWKTRSNGPSISTNVPCTVWGCLEETQQFSNFDLETAYFGRKYLDQIQPRFTQEVELKIWYVDSSDILPRRIILSNFSDHWMWFFESGDAQIDFPWNFGQFQHLNHWSQSTLQQNFENRQWIKFALVSLFHTSELRAWPDLGR